MVTTSNISRSRKQIFINFQLFFLLSITANNFRICAWRKYLMKAFTRLCHTFLGHFWPSLSAVLFLSISLVLLIPKKYSKVSGHFRQAQTLKLWVVVWCTFYHRWAKKWKKGCNEIMVLLQSMVIDQKK